MIKKQILFLALVFCIFIQKTFTQQNQIQGIENTSYQFYSTATFADPRSSYLTLPSLNLTGDYTIEFWYQNGNYFFGSNTPIFDFRSGPGLTNGLFLRQYRSEEKTLEIVANGGYTSFSVASATQANFSIHEWNHYAFVYNATTQNFSVYINGNFISTIANFNPLPVLNTTYCYLGGSNDPGVSSKGRFADFRVWKSNRSLTEIRKYLNFNVPTNSANLYYYLPLKNPAQVFGNSYILDQSQIPNVSIAPNRNPLPSTFTSQNSILSKYNYELNPQPSSLFLTTNANGLNGDHIELPALGNLGANNFTVETWFKIYDRNRAWMRIFETSNLESNIGNNQISLGFSSNTNLLFFSVDGTQPIGVGDENFININTWYHIALTYNATNDTATFYLNGNSILKRKLVAFSGNLPIAFLGASNFPYDSNFVGNLANFRIWTSERTQSEIVNNLYKVDVSTPTLLYYLPLSNPAISTSYTTNIPNNTTLQNASTAPNALTGVSTIKSTNGTGAKYLKENNRNFVYGTLSNTVAPNEYLEYRLPGYDATWRRVDTIIDLNWRANLPYNDRYTSIELRSSVGATRTFTPLAINPAPSDLVFLDTKLEGISGNIYDTSAPPILRSQPGQSFNYQLINPPIGITINPSTGLIYFDKSLSYLSYSFLAQVSSEVGSTIAPVTVIKTYIVTNEIAKVVNNSLYISNNSATLNQKTRVQLPVLDLRRQRDSNQNSFIDFWYKAVPNTTNTTQTATILSFRNAAGERLVITSKIPPAGSRRDSGAFLNLNVSTTRPINQPYNTDVLIKEPGFNFYGWNHYYIKFIQYGIGFQVNDSVSNNVFLSADGRDVPNPVNGTYLQAIFNGVLTDNYFGAGPDGTTDNGAGFFQRLRIRKGPGCCQFLQGDLQLDPQFPYLYYELLFNADNQSKTKPILPGTYSLKSIANYTDLKNRTEYNSIYTPSTLVVPSNATTSARYANDSTYQKVFGYLKSERRDNEIIQYSLDSGKRWTNVSGYSTTDPYYYPRNAWYFNLPTSFKFGLIKVRSNYVDLVFDDYYFNVSPDINYNYHFYNDPRNILVFNEDGKIKTFLPTTLGSNLQYQIIYPTTPGLNFNANNGQVSIDSTLLLNKALKLTLNFENASGQYNNSLVDSTLVKYGSYNIPIIARNEYGVDTAYFRFDKYSRFADSIYGFQSSLKSVSLNGNTQFVLDTNNQNIRALYYLRDIAAYNRNYNINLDSHEISYDTGRTWTNIKNLSTYSTAYSNVYYNSPAQQPLFYPLDLFVTYYFARYFSVNLSPKFKYGKVKLRAIGGGSVYSTLSELDYKIPPANFSYNNGGNMNLTNITRQSSNIYSSKPFLYASDSPIFTILTPTTGISIDIQTGILTFDTNLRSGYHAINIEARNSLGVSVITYKINKTAFTNRVLGIVNNSYNTGSNQKPPNNNKITLPNNLNLSNTPFTIQFWYKSNSSQANQAILYMRNSSYDTAGWLRFIQSNSNSFKLFFGKNINTSQPNVVQVNQPGFNIQSWNHYSLVYAPDSPKTISLLVNGSNTNLSLTTNAVGDTVVNGGTAFASNNFKLSQPFTNNYILGDVDTTLVTNQSIYDFRIFNVALPVAVLAKNYQTPIDPATLGLYYYLPLTNNLINYDQNIANGTVITPANANLSNNTGNVVNPQPSTISSLNDTSFYNYDSARQILYGSLDTPLQAGEYLEYSLNSGNSWTRIDSVLSTPSAAPNYNTNLWFAYLPTSFVNGIISVRSIRSNIPSRRFDDFVYYTKPGLFTYRYNNYKYDTSTNLDIPIITQAPQVRGGNLSFRIINNSNPNISLKDTARGTIQFLANIEAGYYKVDVEVSNPLGKDTASYTLTKFEAPTDTINYLVNNSFTTASLNAVPNSDFIRLPNLDLRNQAFTIEFMFKKNTDTSNTYLYLGSSTSPNTYFFMGQDSSYRNNTQFRIVFNNQNQKNITVRQANFNIKNWNSYAFQYDGDTSVSVYINGALDTVLKSGGFGWLSSKNRAVLLDNNFLGGASSPFRGVSQSSFEDFRIWRSTVLNQNVRTNNQIFSNRYSRVVPEEINLYYNLYLTNPNQQFALIKDYQSISNGSVLNNNGVNVSSLNNPSFVNSVQNMSARYQYQFKNQRLVGSFNGTMPLTDTLYWCATQIWDSLCVSRPTANNSNWHAISVLSGNNWVAYLDSNFVGGQIVVKSSLASRVFKPYVSLSIPAYFKYNQSDSFIINSTKDTTTRAPYCTGGFLRFSIANNPLPDYLSIDSFTGKLRFKLGIPAGKYTVILRATNSQGTTTTNFVTKVLPQTKDQISGVINNAFTTTKVAGTNTDYISLPNLDLANKNVQIDFWYKFNGSSSAGEKIIMLDFRYATQNKIALQMWLSRKLTRDTITVVVNDTVLKFALPASLSRISWNRYVLSNNGSQVQLQVISDLGNSITLTPNPTAYTASNGRSYYFTANLPYALIGGSYDNSFVSLASFRDFKIKTFSNPIPGVDKIDNPDLVPYLDGLYYYLPLTDKLNNITVAIANQTLLQNQSIDFSANPNAAIVNSVLSTNPGIPSGAYYVYEPRHQIVYGQQQTQTAPYATTIKFTTDTAFVPTYLPISYQNTNSWFGFIPTIKNFVNGNIKATVNNLATDALISTRPIEPFYYQTLPNSFTYRVGFYGQFGGEISVSTDTVYTNEPNIIGGKTRFKILTPLNGVSIHDSLGFLTILPSIPLGNYSLVVEAKNALGVANANYFITKIIPPRDTALNYFNNSYQNTTLRPTPNNDYVSMPSFDLSNGNGAWGDYTIEFWYKDDNPDGDSSVILHLDNNVIGSDDAIIFNRMALSNNQFNLRVGNKPLDFEVTQSNFSINNWNHYAFVYNALYGDFYVIINGESSGVIIAGAGGGQFQNRLSGVPGFLSLNNNYLGTNPTFGSSKTSQGRYEDFRLWKSNRNIGDPTEIYKNKDLRLGQRESGLYYNLYLSFRDLSETTPIVNGTPLQNNSTLSSAEKRPSFVTSIQDTGSKYIVDSVRQRVYGNIVKPLPLEQVEFSANNRLTWTNVPSYNVSNGNFAIILPESFKYGRVNFRTTLLQGMSRQVTARIIPDYIVELFPSNFEYSNNFISIVTINGVDSSVKPSPVLGGNIIFLLAPPAIQGVKIDSFTGIIRVDSILAPGIYYLTVLAKNSRGQTMTNFTVGKRTLINDSINILYSTNIRFLPSSANNFISLPALDLRNTSYAVDFWTKYDSITSKPVFEFNDATNVKVGFSMKIVLANATQAVFSFKIDDSAITTGLINVNVSAWNHYALVCDTVGKVFNFYINTTQILSLPLTATRAIIDYITVFNTVGTPGIQLDLFRVWKKSLDTNEIIKSYKYFISPFTPGLVYALNLQNKDINYNQPIEGGSSFNSNAIGSQSVLLPSQLVNNNNKVIYSYDTSRQYLYGTLKTRLSSDLRLQYTIDDDTAWQTLIRSGNFDSSDSYWRITLPPSFSGGKISVRIFNTLTNTVLSQLRPYYAYYQPTGFKYAVDTLTLGSVSVGTSIKPSVKGGGIRFSILNSNLDPRITMDSLTGQITFVSGLPGGVYRLNIRAKNPKGDIYTIYTVYKQAPAINAALYFTNNGFYNSVPQNYIAVPNLNLANSSYTFEFWYRRFGTNNNYILDFKNAANSGIEIFTPQSNQNNLRVIINNISFDIVGPTTSPLNHYAISFNNTNNTLQVYVNGSSTVTLQNIAGVVISTNGTYSNAAFIINAPFINNRLASSNTITASTSANLLLQDFRIWNSVRTASNIAQNYLTKADQYSVGLYYNLYLNFDHVSYEKGLNNRDKLPNNARSLVSIPDSSTFIQTNTASQSVYLYQLGNSTQSLSGTLASPLSASEKIQISIDGGFSWIDAVVSGLNWSVSVPSIFRYGTINIRSTIELNRSFADYFHVVIPIQLQYATNQLSVPAYLSTTSVAPTVVGNFLNYSLTNNTNPGISINANTGVISVAQNALPGNNNLIVNASNAFGSITANFRVVTQAVLKDSILTISNNSFKATYLGSEKTIDRINLPSLDLSNSDYTIEFRYKVENFPQNLSVLVLDYNPVSGTDDAYLRLDMGSRTVSGQDLVNFYIKVNNQDNVVNSDILSSTLRNTWNHYALVYNSTNYGLSLYVNGTLITTLTNASNAIRFGFNQSYIFQSFNSQSATNFNLKPYNIQEFRIWKSARTPLQILYNANSNISALTDGLYYYLPLSLKNYSANVPIATGALLSNQALALGSLPASSTSSVNSVPLNSGYSSYFDFDSTNQRLVGNLGTPLAANEFLEYSINKSGVWTFIPNVTDQGFYASLPISFRCGTIDVRSNLGIRSFATLNFETQPTTFYYPVPTKTLNVTRGGTSVIPVVSNNCNIKFKILDTMNGITISETSGVLSFGSGLAPGYYNFRAQAYNSFGSINTNYTLEVLDSGSNQINYLITNSLRINMPDTLRVDPQTQVIKSPELSSLGNSFTFETWYKFDQPIQNTPLNGYANKTYAGIFSLFGNPRGLDMPRSPINLNVNTSYTNEDRNTKIELYLEDSVNRDSAYIEVFLNNLFSIADWHHYALTYNQSTKTLKLYVDGGLKFTRANFTPYKIKQLNLASFYDGMYKSYGGKTNKKERYQDLRIWTEERSGQDLIQNYQFQINGNDNDSLYYQLPLYNPLVNTTTAIPNQTRLNNLASTSVFNPSPFIVDGSPSYFDYYFEPSRQLLGGSLATLLGATETLQYNLEGSSNWVNISTVVGKNWVALIDSNFRNGLIKVRSNLPNRIFKDFYFETYLHNFTYKYDNNVDNYTFVGDQTRISGPARIVGGNVSYSILNPVDGIGFYDSTNGQLIISPDLKPGSYTFNIQAKNNLNAVVTQFRVTRLAVLKDTILNYVNNNFQVTEGQGSSNDHVILPKLNLTVSNNLINSGYTIEYWYNSNVNNGSDPATVFLSNTLGNYLAIFNTNSKIRLLLSGSTTKDTTIVVSLTGWNHFAFACHATNNTVDVYINGRLSKTVQFEGVFNFANMSNYNSNNYLLSSNLNNNAIRAEMENFRVWQIWKTEAQIYENYLQFVSPISDGLYYSLELSKNNIRATQLIPNNLKITPNNLLNTSELNQATVISNSNLGARYKYNNTRQRVYGNLSTPLDGFRQETLEYSIDSGRSWTGISSVSGTNWIFSLVSTFVSGRIQVRGVDPSKDVLRTFTDLTINTPPANFRYSKDTLRILGNFTDSSVAPGIDVGLYPVRNYSLISDAVVGISINPQSGVIVCDFGRILYGTYNLIVQATNDIGSITTAFTVIKQRVFLNQIVRYANSYLRTSTVSNFANGGDFIKLPALGATVLNGNYTIEGYFELSNINRGRSKLFESGPSEFQPSENSSVSFGFTNDNPARFYVNAGAGDIIEPSATIVENRLTHIAMVKFGDSVIVYKDDNLWVRGLAANITTPQNFVKLMSSNDINDKSVVGVVNEFRIWNVARTQQQVFDNRFFSIDGINSDELIYYQPFNEGIPDRIQYIRNNTVLSNKSNSANALQGNTTIVSQNDNGARYIQSLTNQYLLASYSGDLAIGESFKIVTNNGCNTITNEMRPYIASNNVILLNVNSNFRGGLISLISNTNRSFRDTIVYFVPLKPRFVASQNLFPNKQIRVSYDSNCNGYSAISQYKIVDVSNNATYYSQTIDDTLFNVIQGIPYRFVVSSFNAYGESEVSDTSAPIIYPIRITTAVENGRIPSDSLVQTRGANVTISYQPTNSSYRLDSVVVDGLNVSVVSNANSFVFSNLTQDHAIKVWYSKVTKTIVASAINGSIAPSDNVTVDSTFNQVFTYKPNPGYKLDSILVDGLSVGLDSATRYTFVGVVAPHTIKVVNDKIRYNITSTVVNGSLNYEGVSRVDTNESLRIVYTANSGFVLDSVIVDDRLVTDSTLGYSFNNVNANHTIRVVYKLGYLITTTVVNGTITPTTLVKSGTDYRVTYRPNSTDYTIDSVIVNGTLYNDSVNGYTFNNVSRSYVIRVVYRLKTFAINTLVSNGSITPTAQVTIGGNIRVTYNANATFLLDSVVVDGMLVTDSATGYTLSDVRASHTIKVYYSRSFSIATSVVNGTISDTVFNIRKLSSLRITYRPVSENFLLRSIMVDGVLANDSINGYTFRAIDGNHSIVVNYINKYFTITSSATAGGTVNPNQLEYVSSGASRTIYILANPTFKIDTILLNDSLVYPKGLFKNLSEFDFDLTNIQKNYTIKVSFKKQYYSVLSWVGNVEDTFFARINAGGIISQSGETLIKDKDTLDFYMLPNSGYVFDSLLINGRAVTPFSSYSLVVLSRDYTVRAKFKQTIFTVNTTYELGVKINTGTKTAVFLGQSFVLMYSALPGFVIDSVLLNGVKIPITNQIRFSNLTQNQDVKIYTTQTDPNAVLPKTYKIVSSSNLPYTLSIEGTTEVDSLANQTIYFYKPIGYYLDSVIVDNQLVAGTDSQRFSNVVSNHSVRLFYRLIKQLFTVDFDAGANGIVSPSGVINVVQGGKTKVLIDANLGYVIDSVFVNGRYVSGNYSGLLEYDYSIQNVQQDYTVFVSFRSNLYTITTSINGGGTISPNGKIYVKKGKSLRVVFTIDAGLNIDSVVVNGRQVVDSTQGYTFNDVSANQTLSVYTNATTFIITSIAGANGTITPLGNQNVAIGASKTYSIKPDTSYFLSAVLINNSVLPPTDPVYSSKTYTFSSVNQNNTIEVRFSPIFFRITTSVGIGGSVTPSGSVAVLSGRSQTFNIVADAGYAIDSIFIDNQLITTSASVTISNVRSDRTLKVLFRLLSYRVILSYNKTQGQINLKDTFNVSYGTNLGIVIRANEGYIIDSIFLNGSYISGDYFGLSEFNYIIQNVQQNYKVIIRFKYNFHTITTIVGTGGSVTPSGVVTVPNGGSKTFSIVASAGYVIDSVFIDNKFDTSKNSVTISNVTTDIILKVLFRRLSYRLIVSYDKTQGQINLRDTSNVFYSNNLPLEIRANQGYIIQSIIVNGRTIAVNSSSYSYSFNSITGDINLSVVFGFNGNYKFLPNSNYKIVARDASCNNINNGSIVLNFDSSLKYAYTLTDTLGIRIASDSFVKLDTILSLSAGVYLVNIRLVDYILNDVKQFRIVVKQPSALTAFSELISDGKIVSLTLNGSDYYNISVNGKMFQVNSSQIELPLKTGLNTIKVSTNLACQGEYTQTYLVSETILLYPNPATSFVNLYFGGEDVEVALEVFNEKGVILYQNISKIPGTRQIQLNTDAYPEGVYFVKVKGNTLSGTYKFIKTK